MTKRRVTFELPPTQIEKNAIYKSLGTKEVQKLIKKPKKMDIEKIFIKSNSSKKK